MLAGDQRRSRKAIFFKPASVPFVALFSGQSGRGGLFDLRLGYLVRGPAVRAGGLRIELWQAKFFEHSPASQIKARFRGRKFPFRKDYSEFPIRSDLFTFRHNIDSEELVNFRA